MKLLNREIILCTVCCLLMSLPVLVQAQGQKDSLFYFNTIKIKGIYKTFEEFRRNAPSIPLPRQVVIEYTEEETVYEGVLPIAILNCDSLMPCEKKTPIWGFCDGTTVYISRSAEFDKKNVYDKVRYIGRYLYYQTIEKSVSSATNTGPGASTGGYTMGGPRNKTLLEKAIDINTGVTFELSNAKITKILSDDKVLLAEFKKEKKKEQKQGFYLKKYSEKHKEQVRISY